MVRLTCFNCEGIQFLPQSFGPYDVELSHDDLSNIDKVKYGRDSVAFLFGHEPGEIQNFIKLRNLKISNPSIPIVVVADQYCDELPDLVINSRAWCWVVMPKDHGKLINVIGGLLDIMEQRNAAYTSREVHFPRFHISISSLKRNLTLDYKSNVRVKPALKLVQYNYMHQITVQDLADSCYMSEGHFSREFKRVQGVTVQEYLKQFRVGMAETFLSETMKAIQHIAAETGYKNISNFNHQFKSVTGKTPTRYRQEYNKYLSESDADACAGI